MSELERRVVATVLNQMWSLPLMSLGVVHGKDAPRDVPRCVRYRQAPALSRRASIDLPAVQFRDDLVPEG